jgi:Kdo2-lipid A phosphotransferase
MSSPQKKLSLPLFIIGHILALIILLTWIVPTLHSLWQRIDTSSFLFLNGTLYDRPLWQITVAFLNHKTFDIITALIMTLPLFHYILHGTKGTATSRFVNFSSFAIYTLGSLVAIKHGLKIFFSIHRLSPSLIHDKVFRLSELSSFFTIKDYSTNSFPGDHALVLIMWLGFMAICCSRKHLIVSVFIAIIAALPRLISGAHWMSDNVVGGGFIATILLTWYFATPLRYYTERLSTRICTPAADIIIPILQRVTPFHSA